MSVVVGLLVVLAVAGAMLASAATLAGWLVIRRVRRFRRSAPYRRSTLLVRAIVAPSSAARQITRMRMELFEAVTATGQVLTGIPAPAILQQLADELHSAAEVTDRRLDLLSREPDAAVLRPLLPELTASVGHLRRSAAQIRSTTWQFAGLTDGNRAEILAAEVADQVAGLNAGLLEVQAIRNHRVTVR